MTPHRAAQDELAAHLRLLCELIEQRVPAPSHGNGGARYELHTLRQACEQVAEELEASTIAELARAVRRGTEESDAERARA